MKVKSIKVECADVPTSCRYKDENNTGCSFCIDKYCSLLMALKEQSYVGNNYDKRPNNCPLNN